MKRFFGMMPSACVEKEKRFDTGGGSSLTIQAGPEGWTILYADGGSKYKDVIASTKDNFEEAYKLCCEQFNTLKGESN